MDARSASSTPKAAGRGKVARKEELGPALRRDRLLRRVMAAGRRLPRNPPDALRRLR